MSWELVDREADRGERSERGERLVGSGLLRVCDGRRAGLASAQLALHELAEVRRDRDAAGKGSLAEHASRLVVDGRADDLVLARHGCENAPRRTLVQVCAASGRLGDAALWSQAVGPEGGE